MCKKSHTFILFSTPSFFIGMGSIFNLAGKYFYYNTSDSDAEADYKAIESDWKAVGKDIQDSINTYKEENNKQLELVFNE